MKKDLFKTCILAAALLSASGMVRAQEEQSVETLKETLSNLIDALVKAGAISADKAQELVRDAERRAAETSARNAASAAAAGTPVKPGTVRVPYIPETVRNQIEDSIRAKVLEQARVERWAQPNAIPSWVDRIKWEGDIRFRYQADRFDDNNSTLIPNYAEINDERTLNTNQAFLYTNPNTGDVAEDRARWRLQARLGASIKVGEDTSAGIRFATGNTDDPVSTNSTLANNFNRTNVLLDRAWLSYKPWDFLKVSAGRIPNPWFSPTDLVWDTDLNFDGIAGTGTYNFGEFDSSSVFVTLGAFPLEEYNLINRQKWLYGAQGGIELQGTETKFKAGLAYYDYRGIKGVTNDTLNVFDTDYSAPGYLQKGNTLYNIRNTDRVATDDDAVLFGYASGYRLINLSASLDWTVEEPFHVIVAADYVNNVGFSDAEARRNLGGDYGFLGEPDTKGYQFRIGLGAPELLSRGMWQAFLGYRYVGSDAVLDAFTDSDFHLGGTNAKGFFTGASYAFDKRSYIGLKYLASSEVEGPPLRIDVLQVDLGARF